MAGLSSPICCCTGDGAGGTTTSGQPSIRTKFIQTVSKVLANPAAGTSMIGAGLGSLTLTPSEMVLGTTLRITATGASFAAAAETNVTIDLYLGGVLMASTGAFAPSGTCIAEIKALFTFQSTGTAAVVAGRGIVDATSTNSNVDHYLELDGGFTANTNLAQSLDLVITFTSSDAGNTFAMTTFVLEVLDA